MTNFVVKVLVTFARQDQDRLEANLANQFAVLHLRYLASSTPDDRASLTQIMFVPVPADNPESAIYQALSIVELLLNGVTLRSLSGSEARDYTEEPSQLSWIHAVPGYNKLN